MQSLKKKSSKLGGGSSTLPRPRRISQLSDASDDLRTVSSSSSNYSKSVSSKKKVIFIEDDECDAVSVRIDPSILRK